MTKRQPEKSEQDQQDSGKEEESSIELSNKFGISTNRVKREVIRTRIFAMASFL